MAEFDRAMHMHFHFFRGQHERPKSLLSIGLRLSFACEVMRGMHGRAEPKGNGSTDGEARAQKLRERQICAFYARKQNAGRAESRNRTRRKSWIRAFHGWNPGMREATDTVRNARKCRFVVRIEHELTEPKAGENHGGAEDTESEERGTRNAER